MCAPEVAVDLLAETFAVAFEDRRQFRGRDDDAARAWLFGIARHRVTDYFPRGAVERRALARLGVDRRPLTDVEYDRIEELAASSDLRDRVAGELAALPAGARDRRLDPLAAVRGLVLAATSTSILRRCR